MEKEKDMRILNTVIFFLCVFLITDSCNALALNIALKVKESDGITRFNEMIHNGIPISRKDNITDISDLVIVDEAGNQVPATFEVLSRWGGGKDDETKSVQWLLISFPVTLNANSSATYYLRHGTPVKKELTVSLDETLTNFVVNTGVAKFVISKTEMSLFESISSISDGKEKVVLAGHGGSFSQISGQTIARANAPKDIVVERQNDHYVCIKIEGDYANEPIGAYVAKPLSYKLRYEFFAGSETAILNFKFYWSGRTSKLPSNNIISVEKISLLLPGMNGFSSVNVYTDAITNLKGTLLPGQNAGVAQKLRDIFSDPSQAVVYLGDSSKITDFANRPVLVNWGEAGGIAVSIDHMKDYEPQSIETDSSGQISVNVLAQHQDLADCQGSWARVGVTVLPSTADYNKILRVNFAPLNYRIMAFPETQYVADSKVFLDIPAPLNSAQKETKLFYDELQEVTATTQNWLNINKWQGLMTWGSLTRYPSEVGTGENWDKIYAGAKLTDYHNAWNNVTFQFFYSGDARLLYDYAFAGARRMLNTQIIQPDAEHSSSYMGWGYSGYLRYRSDTNSSHSYFENLYNYYYLTGDMEVIDILKVAGETKRRWYTRDANGLLNDVNTPGQDWIKYVGRVAYQSASIMYFLGHTFDASYLDDFQHMYAHAFTHSIALLYGPNKVEYGFVSAGNDASSGFNTDQFWMTGLYFLHGLNLLYEDFGDLSLGATNLLLSRVYKDVAYGMMDYASTVIGDGSWEGDWINSAVVIYTGNKIGGNLVSVTQYPSSDPKIYLTGKPNIAVAILYGGALSGDSRLQNFGAEGVKWLLSTPGFASCSNKPWGKENGIMFCRLHHAIGLMDESFGMVPVIRSISIQAEE